MLTNEQEQLAAINAELSRLQNKAAELKTKNNLAKTNPKTHSSKSNNWSALGKLTAGGTIAGGAAALTVAKTKVAAAADQSVTLYLFDGPERFYDSRPLNINPKSKGFPALVDTQVADQNTECFIPFATTAGFRTNLCKVPSDAKGIVGNLTIIIKPSDADGICPPGSMKFFAGDFIADTPQKTTPVINWQANNTTGSVVINNQFVTRLSNADKVRIGSAITIPQASLILQFPSYLKKGSTTPPQFWFNFLIDLAGYYK